jgi:hypothetical protein
LNPPARENMRIYGAPTLLDLEEAETQFQKSWSAWKAWAKLDEVRNLA